MPEPDELRSAELSSAELSSAFEDLRIAVLPAVRPPGVAAVRHTVHRRRTVRLGVGTAAAAALAISGFIVMPRQHQPRYDLGDPSVSTSPATGGSGGPSASTASSAGSIAILSDTQPPATSTKSKANCPTDWLVDLKEPFDHGWVRLAARVDGADLSCSDGQIRVFWASYTIESTGLQRLYRSEIHYLSRLAPSVLMHIELPRECDVAWYLVAGDQEVLRSARGSDAYRPKGIERGRIDYEIRTGCPSKPG
jgi:hypothetical protein